MSNQKKLLSVILALILALSGFTAVPLSASAAAVDTTPAGAPDIDGGDGSKGSLYDRDEDGYLNYRGKENNEYCYSYDWDAGVQLSSIYIKNGNKTLTIPATLPTEDGDQPIPSLDECSFYFTDPDGDCSIAVLDLSQLPADAVDRFLEENGKNLAGYWDEWESHFHEGCFSSLDTLILPESCRYYMKDGVCLSKDADVKLFDLNDWDNHAFHPTYTDADCNEFLCFPSEYSYDLTVARIKNKTSKITMPKTIPDGDENKEVRFDCSVFRAKGRTVPITEINLSQSDANTVDFSLNNMEDEYLIRECPSLQSLILPEDCDYTMEDGVCYRKSRGEAIFSLNDEANGTYFIETNGGKLFYTVSGSVANKVYRLYGAENLVGDVMIPDGVNGHTWSNDWDSAIFSNLPEMTSVTVPENVPAEFRHCEKLRSITFTGKEPFLANTDYSGGFVSDCPSLVEINFPDCDSLSFENGMLIRSGNELLLCLNQNGRLVIPDTVTEIAYGAFDNSKKLTSITVPATVTSSLDVIHDLPVLKEVVLPEGLTAIDYQAFAECPKLDTVNIPSTVKTIRAGAFDGCTSLSHIDLPDSLTAIGNFAFRNCDSMTSVTIPASVSFIGPSAFGRTNPEDFTIYGYYGTAAEKHAALNGFRFIAVAPATSDEVEVDSPDGCEFSVVDMDGRATADEATPDEAGVPEELPEGSVILDSFDIKLRDKDGNPIQPASPVTVRIRCANPHAKVYCREADGSLTDMKARWENGWLIFEADHFSLYLVVAPPAGSHLLGDVDGDGAVTIIDATYIQRHLADLPLSFEFDDSVADADGDGNLTILDATEIQRWLAGLPVHEGIEKPI